MSQKVLITGASSGIGREFAYLYAAEAAHVILVSRSASALESLKKELLQKHTCEVTIFVQDLSTPGAARRIHQKTGSVDVLVNNAGVGEFGALVDKSVQEITAMLHLNMIALTELCMLYGKDFKTKRSGAILNVASVVGFQPVPYFAAYAASKAYVLSLSEALAAELAEFNVTVTCLCPGATNTRFFERAGKTTVRGSMNAQEVARIGKRALESGKKVVIPGLQNRLMILAQRFLPRRTVLFLAKKLMKKYG